MNLDESPDTCCAVCGKDVSHVPGVARLYHEGRRFPLCCPLCIEMFQRAPVRFANGERPQSLVENLIEEIKWRTGP